MDRAMIKEHLALAERHVIEGAERVRRQREILAEMIRDNHLEAAYRAASILRQFEQTQAIFIADLYRLELASRNSC